MPKTFVPLTLELIEEGTFVSEANNDLMRLQSELLRHVEKYGSDAKGAKAMLTIKIALQCTDPEQELYVIKTACTMATPARPSGLSAAVADFTEDHKAALFVRQSGSDQGNPRQKKLATRDGRNVQPEVTKADQIEE